MITSNIAPFCCTKVFRNPINSGANVVLSGQYSASATPDKEEESGGTSTRDVLDILIKQERSQAVHYTILFV